MIWVTAFSEKYRKKKLDKIIWIDFKVKCAEEEAQLQKLRFVELLAQSQKIPTIKLKYIDIIAGI